jgi:hypothetical protein
MTSAGTGQAGEPEPTADAVELVIPSDLVVLARLTASTVASTANFDVEEIEDLRLAVDELCIMTVGEQTGGRLALRFSLDDDVLEVSCTYLAGSIGGVEAAPASAGEGLSELIIDALVDDHGSEEEGGVQRAWLRKRRTRQEV